VLRIGHARSVTFLIRSAVPADMTVLRDLFRRSSLSNEGDRPLLLANPDALELSAVAVNERRTRVAEVADGPIVGFASTMVTGDVIELEDLFVDPEWIRRGIARALVLDTQAIARQSGCRRVQVTANEHARGFYEKVGFVFAEEVETRFRPAPRMHLDVV
jgi:N-acetylglutamate synthase-like GNAT family acetyltransferase